MALPVIRVVAEVAEIGKPELDAALATTAWPCPLCGQPMAALGLADDGTHVRLMCRRCNPGAVFGGP